MTPVLLFRKKKKEEARKAELAFSAEAEDDCSAVNPKCKRPTGKQVRFRSDQTLILIENSKNMLNILLRLVSYFHSNVF